MGAEKLSSELVEAILRLSREETDPGTIAQKLDLRRLEVAAILAHQKLRHDPAMSSQTERLGESATKDLWSTSPPEEVSTKSGKQLEARPEEPENGIYIGEEEDLGTPAFWDPADAHQVQNPHLMIMGESGSGKTYAVQCLVSELAHAGVPSIIFDYGQSFETDKLDRTFLKYCDPQEHRIGEDGLALNPFEIFSQDTRGPNTVATRLADVFDAAYRLGDIQRKVFIEAVLQTYRNAGITAQDSKTWSHPPPNLTSLNETIEVLAADRQNPNYRNAASLAARLTSFFMLVALSDERWSWDKMISDSPKRVHILQFRGLEGKTRRVLVELLLWHMFFHLKSHGQHPLRAYCILDEAHHLSFRESGPLENILREARKFGLGLIFASQQPQDFSPVAYSNTASKLIFQTADPDLKVSKFLTSKSMNHDKPDEIQALIASLERGHAFFITKNRGHSVSVAGFPKRATQWSK